MKTIFVKPKDVERKWYLVDASDKRLGRIATRVATILRGKNRPYYTPHQEVGDYVIIINAGKIALSGRKSQQKLYHRHSGYPGGLRSESFQSIMQRKPTFPMEQAIRGMLPKGPMGRKLFKNVKVYAGAVHPHAAQMPEIFEID